MTPRAPSPGVFLGSAILPHAPLLGSCNHTSIIYDVSLMSRSLPTRAWGPSHEHRPPPHGHRWRWKLGAITLVLVAFELFTHKLADTGPRGAAGSTLTTMAPDGTVL